VFPVSLLPAPPDGFTVEPAPAPVTVGVAFVVGGAVAVVGGRLGIDVVVVLGLEVVEVVKSVVVLVVESSVVLGRAVPVPVKVGEPESEHESSKMARRASAPETSELSSV